MCWLGVAMKKFPMIKNIKQQKISKSSIEEKNKNRDHSAQEIQGILWKESEKNLHLPHSDQEIESKRKSIKESESDVVHLPPDVTQSRTDLAAQLRHLTQAHHHND